MDAFKLRHRCGQRTSALLVGNNQTRGRKELLRGEGLFWSEHFPLELIQGKAEEVLRVICEIIATIGTYG